MLARLDTGTDLSPLATRRDNLWANRTIVSNTFNSSVLVPRAAAQENLEKMIAFARRMGTLTVDSGDDQSKYRLLRSFVPGRQDV